MLPMDSSGCVRACLFQEGFGQPRGQAGEVQGNWGQAGGLLMNSLFLNVCYGLSLYFQVFIWDFCARLYVGFSL